MVDPHFGGVLAMVGIVIIIASLLSGAVERSGFPEVAVFLLVGLLLGPAGLDLIDFGLGSPTLRAIATLALLFVLFSDAVGADTGEIRIHRRLAALILGPGTLLPAALIALAAWAILGLSPPMAAILGAALASTDPVLLGTLLRRPELPAPARLGLRLESGMNDAILLPIVVLAILAIGGGAPGAEDQQVMQHVVGLFLLGPALGALTGYVAITILDQVRRRVGVRRDYESLYALGVALTAYAVAESVGGSGFLAAFFAGIVIAWLDVELCDCFRDYGAASAEMFLLLTFVAFGTGLIWTGLSLLGDWRVLLFAIVALLLRTAVLLPVLRHSEVDRRSRIIIALFGPRGLSSLLLVLLPVFAGVPGAEQLFVITCLVVLLSVVLHGAGIALYLGRAGRRAAPVAAGASTPPAPPHSAGDEAAPVPERITIGEYQQLRRAGEPVVLADVRTERSYRDDPDIAAGAIRLPPDDAVRLARERRLDRHATLVLYCT